jgi:uncharacterized membrane protein YfcA
MSAAGFLTGIVSGLFGIGGGVILIPILVFLFNYKQQTASGTSLVAMLLPVGLLGVLQYLKSGLITYQNVKYGLMIGVGIFLGTYFGAVLAGHIGEVWLKKGFALILLIMAFRIWFQS